MRLLLLIPLAFVIPAAGTPSGVPVIVCPMLTVSCCVLVFPLVVILCPGLPLAPCVFPLLFPLGLGLLFARIPLGIMRSLSGWGRLLALPFPPPWCI